MHKYHLQTLALRLRPGKLDHTFHTVRVPNSWIGETRDLQAERTNRNQAQTTVPFDNLNQALRALFPDLLAIGKNAWRQGQPYWLLSDHALPLDALTLFVREWANASFPDLPPARRNALLNVLHEVPLAPLSESINLASWTTRYGTASYEGQADIFNLLPHFIAARFCRKGVPRPGWGDFTKAFYRIPLQGDARGAEIMSWPPEKFDGGRTNGNADYFSVVITFTLQNIPFDPHPVIHCDIGLRRWVSRPLWGMRSASSVYLFAQTPWIEGSLSNSFTLAPMHRYVVGSNSDGSAIFESGWGKKNVLTRILSRANLSQKFPTASDIFEQPLEWLTSKGDVQAAISWAASLGYKNRPEQHSVGTGLPHLDRQKIWEWVCSIVAPDLEAAEPIPTFSMPQWTPKLTNPFFPDKPKAEAEPNTEDDESDDEVEEIIEPLLSMTDSDQIERSNLLKNAVGPAVEIGLYYDSESIRKEVETTLSALFGVSPHAPHHQLPNGVTVHWNPIKKEGELFTPLFLGDNPDSRLKSNQVRAAIEQRRDALKAALAPAIVPAVSIIELDDYRNGSLSHRTADPKTAIRKGFAHSDRLTQFLTPPLDKKSTDTLPVRTVNAVLDALRQLGVQTPVPSMAKKRPLNSQAELEPLQYVGYWLAKHTRGGSRTGIGANLPLFVKIDAGTGQVTAQALSVTNAQGFQTWMPYRELLLHLGRDEYDILNAYEHGTRFVNYTQDRVNDLVGKNYVLFAHAQNSRKDGWHYIANANLETNRLGFERRKTSAPITHSPGLHVVRVRDESDHETPESFVCRVDKADAVLVPAAGKGIYPLNENAFYIRTGRPHSMQRVNATMSKLTPRPGTNGRQFPPQAGETTPHVRLLEVIPFGMQPGDAPFAFAALTLKLCEAATHFNGATALPLPLHLANQIEEYLHPLPTDTPDEEESEDIA